MLGVELLPKGKRRDELQRQLLALLMEVFGQRILPFDEKAAVIFSAMVGSACKAGKSISVPDGQSASICKLHGFSIATRDTRPFKSLGIATINPWDWMVYLSFGLGLSKLQPNST